MNLYWNAAPNMHGSEATKTTNIDIDIDIFSISSGIVVV